MPDSKNSYDDKLGDVGQKASGRPKEKEPEPLVDAGVIAERDREAEAVVEQKIQKELGNEAKLRHPKVEISPEVADAGVKSPENDASKVVQDGATFELPMTEKELRGAEHAKLNAQVDDKRNVFGVSSAIALAIFVGRLIKTFHHNAKKFVFRKESEE